MGEGQSLTRVGDRVCRFLPFHYDTLEPINNLDLNAEAALVDLRTPPLVVSTPAIQTCSRAISSCWDRPTLTVKSSAYLTGNAPPSPLMFLLAGIPQRLQNYDDPVSQSMTLPLLPENLNELDRTGQTRTKEVYCDRLVRYHYFKSTEMCNKLHYAAFTDPVYALRSRFYQRAHERARLSSTSLRSY
ncbi:hypothetical protein H2248_002845 [Termitomyces sp. 'cryptogamus']|nr:hypothetical protein H2248_002845 [Termitomyces sp. 'cryptogamus']